jgi:hypothetical protein
MMAAWIAAAIAGLFRFLGRLFAPEKKTGE